MTDSGFMKFEASRIAEVAVDLQNCQTECVQNIGNIRQRVNALRPTWNSDFRADNFYGELSRLDASGEELMIMLKEFSDGLCQAAGIYVAGEKDSKQNVESLPTDGVFRFN